MENEDKNTSDEKLRSPRPAQETPSLEPCGCSLNGLVGGLVLPSEINLCPLHSAAPTLHKALSALYGVSVPSIERTCESYHITKKRALEMARAALALADDSSASSGDRDVTQERSGV